MGWCKVCDFRLTSPGCWSWASWARCFWRKTWADGLEHPHLGTCEERRCCRQSRRWHYGRRQTRKANEGHVGWNSGQSWRCCIFEPDAASRRSFPRLKSVSVVSIRHVSQQWTRRKEKERTMALCLCNQHKTDHLAFLSCPSYGTLLEEIGDSYLAHTGKYINRWGDDSIDELLDVN